MSNFNDLWEHFLSDDLSAEEREILSHLLETEDPRVPEAIGTLLKDEEVRGMGPVGRGEILLQRVLEAGRAGDGATVRSMESGAGVDEEAQVVRGNGVGGTVQTVRMIRRRWMWAAAVVLLLAGGAVFFFVRKGHGPLEATAPDVAQKEILPGRSGAMLTLSNGSQILLDTAGNGMVASDSRVRVVKKDGQLMYEGAAAETVYNNVATPRGRQWQLMLGDGTKVWLNAASSIRYPVSFGKEGRMVEITGEVYFEVAKDETRPFIVKTPVQEIMVLGTHFDVNAYSDEPVMRTTLLEGSVSVKLGQRQVVLRPGQEAVSGGKDGELKTNEVEAAAAIAWINGRFRFDNVDIRTVMRQIARWYDVEVEYQGKVPDYRFSGGTYRNSNLSEVLQVLELNGLHFKTDHRKIIVMQ